MARKIAEVRQPGRLPVISAQSTVLSPWSPTPMGLKTDDWSLTTMHPPASITRRDDGILVEWDRSGDRTFYPARALRLACPCAECVEEMSGRALLDPARIPPDVRPLSIQLVGAYGIRVRWSDGHDTGIYTFERLREGLR